MLTPYNSTEKMTENKFVTLNQYPKDNIQNNEQRNRFKRTQTLTRNPSEYSTTQSNSKSGNNSRINRGRKRKRNREREKVATDSTSNPMNKQKSDSVAQKIYLWCAQCCQKKKSKLTEARKKKANFCKRLRDKCKKRKKKKKKKKTSFSEDNSVSTIQQEAVVGEVSKERQRRYEKVHTAKDSKKSRKRKKKGIRDSPDSSMHIFQADEGEEMTKDLVPNLGIDFTKSCCYLCAKNTMAIAAAVSKVEKFHMSIQASTKETLTSDKSCSPEMYVRTVQSSVKVKMRDMGTSFPEQKKSKKGKSKLKFKKLNILPKLKNISFPTYPKVRTVACETDKSMRHNNIPQCRARRGTHCVTQVNKT